LLEAGQRWGDRQLTEAGSHLALDILRLLMRRTGGRIVLLPGLRGFERADYTVINLSYYVFPALPVLAAACPDPAWLQVAAHGITMLRAARFGQWQLPADWVAVPTDSATIFPAPGWPARFSYDAVRVPLYMAWAGLAAESVVIDAIRWWSDPRRRMLPAWVDVVTGATANYAAPVGMAAIADLAISAAKTGRPQALPAVSTAPDYYSAALTMLAHLAWSDIGLATS
jgi:endoglucanase